MKVIHLLRKPCSESTVAANVLRWGTGALNIDASRVAHDASVDMNAVQRQQATGGKWPANLVLQHLDGCRRVGEVQVRSDGHHPASRPKGSEVSGPSGHRGQSDLAERHLDGEAVVAWSCAPGCPVAALDGQSGECPSTMAGRLPNSTVVPNPGTSAYRSFGTIGGGVGNVYADTGGASRFFKQFGGGEP